MTHCFPSSKNLLFATLRLEPWARCALSGAAALFLVACGGGQYGNSRAYESLSAEQAALEGARPYDPVMARRFPEEWRKTSVDFFGIVTRRDDAADGSELTLSLRMLEARNLCADKSESSCKTTVSERPHGTIHVRVKFESPEDELGDNAVGIGSLVRVVGKLHEEHHAADDTEIATATYYRHWPRGAYVTTAAKDVMRR